MTSQLYTDRFILPRYTLRTLIFLAAILRASLSGSRYNLKHGDDDDVDDIS